VGEYEGWRPTGLPLVAKGEEPRLAGLPARDPETTLYLGGVAYCVPGVTGGPEFGLRPSRERWVGVNGISERSSFGRNSGYKAVRMLTIKSKRNMTRRTSAFAVIPAIAASLCVVS
jgi:hypothetical protein